MSPPRRRDRWLDFDRPYAPRRGVEGGVRVGRPGKVHAEEPARLVAVVEFRTTSGIASRGRTYARAGQVVEVRIADGTASAAIQGSDVEPYAVSLTREPDGGVEATCTCPYGCDAVEWCKHAAALGYVVAHLVDTDAGLSGQWAGTGPGAADGSTDADGADGGTGGSGRSKGGAAADAVPSDGRAALVAALRTAAGAERAGVDARAQWRAAVEVLPLP